MRVPFLNVVIAVAGGIIFSTLAGCGTHTIHADGVLDVKPGAQRPLLPASPETEEQKEPPLTEEEKYLFAA